MRLYLIRHCQSENNALWYRTGSGDGRFADPLLTEKGVKQADILAAYLRDAKEPSDAPFTGGPVRKGLSITHLYCSLMMRAVQTATPIARALDLPLVAWPEIHERGGIYQTNSETGMGEGLPGPGRTFFEETYAHLALPDSLDDSGWWNRPYEEHDEALERAANLMQALMERHGGTDDHVAFVTHGGFTQSILQTVFGIDPHGSQFSAHRHIWLKSNNGSITRIEIGDELLRLTYLNFIDYMPGDLLT